MASRVEKPVVNSTDASGSTTIIVEDFKLWTGRFVFAPTGGAPSCTYSVKMLGDSSESSSTAHVLFSGTAVSTFTDVLINNNDGAGCPMTAYAILIEWSSMADGVVNVGFRKSY